MRKYCSALSVGSKMKEIKSEQFLSIPIPEIAPKVLKRVYKLFYTDNFDKNIDNILSLQPCKVGLFHLSIAENILAQYLNSVLDMIIDNIDFNIVNNKIIR